MPPRPNVAQPEGLEVAAFRGIRYASAGLPDLASVIAPPYDLIDRAAAERLRATHPHNVVRLIRPGEDGDPDLYRSAGSTLRRWLAEGVLATDPHPALYIYEQRSDAHTLRGLLAVVRLARPETGIVQPHEDITPEPVADRLRLMYATGANLEPVLLLYQSGGSATASALVEDVAAGEQPVCVATTGGGATTGDGITYRLWAVTDTRRHARVAQDLFPRTALVADGHHRYAAYLRFQAEQHAAGHGAGPWDYGLAMLVDSSTHPPHLGAVHRVLPRLPHHEAAERARDAFRVTPVGSDGEAAREALADAARRGPAFLLAGPLTSSLAGPLTSPLTSRDGHHLVTDPEPELLRRSLPPEYSARWAQLSTAVLHHLLIPRVWGLTDDEGSVLTVHDAAEAYRAAERSEGTAVLMHPLHVADVRAVARGGERVPRKSTSFGPKPPTGLVLRGLGASR